jgi:hypothetical protein
MGNFQNHPGMGVWTILRQGRASRTTLKTDREGAMTSRRGLGLLCLTVFVLTWLLPTIASAQQYRFIRNHWKNDQYIHIEHGQVRAGTIQPGWWSAQWELQNIAGQSEVRIRNRWKSDQYLHIENGGVQSGPIQQGWWSAQWNIEPVPGTDFVRVRNRWKPDQYLHVERGGLESGPIQPGWWSAMWTLETSGPAARPASSAPPVASKEQACIDAVQGRVAWNQSGERRWQPQSVERLCAGSPDPSLTIRCFEAQIALHGDWKRGIANCQP